MLQLKSILHPTDFSLSSARAFSVALRLARDYGADLHLLHVVERAGLEETESNADRSTSEDEVEEIIEAIMTRMEPLASLGREGGIQIYRQAVPPSDASTAVLNYATREGIELIVIGSGRAVRARGNMLGSVAERVLEKSSCAVLTVGPGRPVREPIKIRQILVPVDFSDQSVEAVRNAVNLARTYGARVKLLHIVDQPVYPSFYRAPTSDSGVDFHLRAEERCETALLRLLDHVEIGRVPWSIEVDSGNVPLKILTHAQMCAADLIIVGSSGLHEGDHLDTMGSVTSNLNRMADCPVLTVRLAGGARTTAVRQSHFREIWQETVQQVTPGA